MTQTIEQLQAKVVELEKDLLKTKLDLLTSYGESEELSGRIAELTAEAERLKAALTQFLDQEGNPPEDTGEWRFVLQVLGECK